MEKRMKYIFTAFLTFIFTIMSVFVAPTSTIANAEVLAPTEVLDDLNNDSKFDESLYPSLTYEEIKELNNDLNPDNNQALFEIIQIAENTDKGLYLYVYQPTSTTLSLSATAVSISIGFSANGENLNPTPYDLRCLSYSGVFYKYEVENFKIPDEGYRYYNIVAIYREFNEVIDTETAGTDGKEIGISVGQQWCLYKENGQVKCEMNTFETVKINVDFTGNFTFWNGINLGSFVGQNGYGDAWFISFSFDSHKVEKIFDATLSYDIRTAKDAWTAPSPEIETTYGDWNKGNKVSLSSIKSMSYEGDGLFSKKFEWKEILPVSDFLATVQEQGVSLSDKTKSDLEKSQWVFSFLVTSHKTSSGTGWTQTEYYDVAKVTILTLRFMDVHKDIYNLGVVSDRVNPDNVPDGYGGLDISELEDWFEILIALIAVVALMVFLWPLLQPILNGIFNAIWWIIKTIINAVGWILLLPIRLIQWLLGKR